jgi:hypothetical protein
LLREWRAQSRTASAQQLRPRPKCANVDSRSKHDDTTLGADKDENPRSCTANNDTAENGPGLDKRPAESSRDHDRSYDYVCLVDAKIRGARAVLVQLPI